MDTNPHGYQRRLLQLAVPLLVTQAAVNGRFFFGTYVIGQVGAADLAVFALVSSVVEVMITVLLALTVGIGQLTAQHAIDERSSKKCLLNALALTFVMGVLLTVLVWYFRPIAEVLHIPLSFPASEAGSIPGRYADLDDEADQFFKYYALGMPPFCIAAGIRFFLLGTNHPKAISATNIAGLLVCLPLIYAFVPGHWGFPRMLVPGFAIAVTISFWLILAVLAGYVYVCRKELMLTGTPVRWTSLYDWKFQKEALSLGAPISVLGGSAVLFLAILVFFVRRDGTDDLAAYQVVMQLSLLSLIWAMSVGEALVILCGRALREAHLRFNRLYSAALQLAVLWAVALCVLLLAFESVLLPLFLKNEAALTSGKAFFPALICVILFSASRAIGFSLLRGFKQLVGPMLVMLGTYALGVAALTLIYGYTHWGGPAFLWVLAGVNVVSSALYSWLVWRSPKYQEHRRLSAQERRG